MTGRDQFIRQCKVIDLVVNIKNGYNEGKVEMGKAEIGYSGSYS